MILFFKENREYVGEKGTYNTFKVLVIKRIGDSYVQVRSHEGETQILKIHHWRGKRKREAIIFNGTVIFSDNTPKKFLARMSEDRRYIYKELGI